MSSSTLIRLCGLALVASSVLFVISILGYLTGPRPGTSWGPEHSPTLDDLTSFIGVLVAPLEVLGLVGLYIRKPQATGVFGLVAFIIAFFGGMLQAGEAWYARFVEWVLYYPELVLVLYPPVNPEPYGYASIFTVPGPYAVGSALTYPLYLLGWMLLGIAFLRARLFPRPAVVSLIVVSLASVVISIVSAVLGWPEASSVLPYMEIAIGILQNAVLAWLGFALWLGWTGSRNRPGTLAESRLLP